MKEENTKKNVERQKRKYQIIIIICFLIFSLISLYLFILLFDIYFNFLSQYFGKESIKWEGLTAEIKLSFIVTLGGINYFGLKLKLSNDRNKRFNKLYFSLFTILLIIILYIVMLIKWI